MEKDPRELSNLINLLPGKAEEMSLTLMDALPHAATEYSDHEQAEPDSADVEALKALGYL